MLQQQKYIWKSELIKHPIDVSAAGHASFHWKETEVLSTQSELSSLQANCVISQKLGGNSGAASWIALVGRAGFNL